jgi:hypothetical protein
LRRDSRGASASRGDIYIAIYIYVHMSSSSKREAANAMEGKLALTLLLRDWGLCAIWTGKTTENQCILRV